MGGGLTRVDDATFEAEVLRADLPVLVEFTAPWCKPCQAIEPHLLDLAERHEGRLRVVQLDIDANLAVPSRYDVLSLPTVIGFRDGEAVVTLAGAKQRGAYDDAVSRLLS